MTTNLDAARIGELLKTKRYGRSLDVRGETGSTMDDARRASEDGAKDGHVIVADSQTAGRGSRGRSWDSPPGLDLYFSIVSRPTVDLWIVSPLTLAIGLGVREVAAQFTKKAAVKWPNDVWVNGKKSAGILVETRAMISDIPEVIIGVGVNVNRLKWEKKLDHPATSFLQAAKQTEELDRNEVLANLLLSIETYVDKFVEAGSGAIVKELNEHLALKDEQVQCDETVGTLLGMSESGSLRIKTDKGVVELNSGRLTAK